MSANAPVLARRLSKAAPASDAANPQPPAFAGPHHHRPQHERSSSEFGSSSFSGLIRRLSGFGEEQVQDAAGMNRGASDRTALSYIRANSMPVGGVPKSGSNASLPPIDSGNNLAIMCPKTEHHIQWTNDFDSWYTS